MHPRFTIEVRMLKDTWIEFVPEQNDEIPNYEDMRFKERAIAHIDLYNDRNEFPKEIVSYVAKSSLTGEKLDLNNVYGLCIDPDGDSWKVGYCDHKSVVGFGYNFCEDWILTVSPRGEMCPRMCVRLVPNRVSEKAIKKAIKVVKRSDAKAFLIETILTNKIYDKYPKGVMSEDYGFTKTQAIEKLLTVNQLDIGICGIKEY